MQRQTQSLTERLQKKERKKRKSKFKLFKRKRTALEDQGRDRAD